MKILERLQTGFSIKTRKNKKKKKKNRGSRFFVPPPPALIGLIKYLTGNSKNA